MRTRSSKSYALTQPDEYEIAGYGLLNTIEESFYLDDEESDLDEDDEAAGEKHAAPGLNGLTSKDVERSSSVHQRKQLIVKLRIPSRNATPTLLSRLEKDGSVLGRKRPSLIVTLRMPRPAGQVGLLVAKDNVLGTDLVETPNAIAEDNILGTDLVETPNAIAEDIVLKPDLVATPNAIAEHIVLETDLVETPNAIAEDIVLETDLVETPNAIVEDIVLEPDAVEMPNAIGTDLVETPNAIAEDIIFEQDLVQKANAIAEDIDLEPDLVETPRTVMDDIPRTTSENEKLLDTMRLEIQREFMSPDRELPVSEQVWPVRIAEDARCEESREEVKSIAFLPEADSSLAMLLRSEYEFATHSITSPRNDSDFQGQIEGNAFIEEQHQEVKEQFTPCSESRTYFNDRNAYQNCMLSGKDEIEVFRDTEQRQVEESLETAGSEEHPEPHNELPQLPPGTREEHTEPHNELLLETARSGEHLELHKLLPEADVHVQVESQPEEESYELPEGESSANNSACNSSHTNTDDEAWPTTETFELQSADVLVTPLTMPSPEPSDSGMALSPREQSQATHSMKRSSVRELTPPQSRERSLSLEGARSQTEKRDLSVKEVSPQLEKERVSIADASSPSSKSIFAPEDAPSRKSSLALENAPSQSKTDSLALEDTLHQPRKRSLSIESAPVLAKDPSLPPEDAPALPAAPSQYEKLSNARKDATSQAKRLTFPHESSPFKSKKRSLLIEDASHRSKKRRLATDDTSEAERHARKKQKREERRERRKPDFDMPKPQQVRHRTSVAATEETPKPRSALDHATSATVHKPKPKPKLKPQRKNLTAPEKSGRELLLLERSRAHSSQQFQGRDRFRTKTQSAAKRRRDQGHW